MRTNDAETNYNKATVIADFVPECAIWRRHLASHCEHFATSQTPTSVFGPLCGNMTSSGKPEVHNVLHCRQKRTEPRPQVTGREDIVEIGHVVFEICSRTHNQTDRQTVEFHIGPATANARSPNLVTIAGTVQ